MKMTQTDLRRIHEDETQPQADRLNALLILALIAVQKAGLAPAAAAIAKPAAPPPAPAAPLKPKASADEIIATIDVRIGDYGPASGHTADGKPWGNVLAWRDLPDGDSQRLKLVAWGEGRVAELKTVGPGDIVRIKVREYGVDNFNGQQTKTARIGGVQILHQANRAAPVDDYADFGAARRPAAEPTPVAVGADGFPAGDDIPF